MGYDALAVFIHPENPVQSLSTEQLARIYRRCKEYDNWSDLQATPAPESTE